MKSILIVADESGWIFERHAIEIQKRLKEFHIDIAFRKMNIPEMSKDYDIVYVMDPIPLKYGYPPKDKTIMGLRCEFLYKEHPFGAYGLYWNGFPGRCVSIQDKCKIFHVVNKNQIEEFKDVVTDKPLLLAQHGVDQNLFNGDCVRDYGSRKIRVGIVGRSSPNKGFNIVKRACEMAGVGFLTAQYGHLKIPREKMPDYYKTIDVYVCMSETEGLNNAILEAGAMRLPIISTKTGASEEIIVDNVNGYFSKRDPQSLSRLLIKLKDGQLRKRIGEKMQENIMSQWTWSKRIEDFRNMFGEIW